MRGKLAPQLCIGHRQHILASSHLGGLYRLSVKHKLRFFLRILQGQFYASLLLVNLRIHLHIAYLRRHAQLHTAQHAVPHYLRVVGVGMRQVIYGYIV